MKCADSRYAYASTNLCVDTADAELDGIIFAGDKNTVCSKYRGGGAPCGVTRSGEALGTCAAPARCVCAEDTFLCVSENKSCGSHYQWVNGACVDTLIQMQIEDVDQQVDSEGYCPGQPHTSGGTGGTGGVAAGGSNSGGMADAGEGGVH